jgi:hypothetical protein
MATTVTVQNFAVTTNFQLAGAGSGGATNLTGQPTTNGFAYTYANGSGAGQVNLCYNATFTIAASATHTATLSALTDPLGVSIAFAKVKFFFIQLLATTTASGITFGPGATHGWNVAFASTIEVKNGGAALPIFDITAPGYAVTSNSLDQVDIINLDGANTATVSLLVFGA